VQRSERQKVIIRSVDSGERSVNDLVALTGASAISIRRDLTELAEQGALRRVRGGAAPVATRGSEYPFALRRGEDSDEKTLLAQAVAGMISPGDSVLIDNGTTALAVAHELAGLGITALALSLHAAAALARTPGNEVIVPGGPVGHDDLAFTGAGAAEAIRAMRFDVAILGACADRPDRRELGRRPGQAGRHRVLPPRRPRGHPRQVHAHCGAPLRHLPRPRHSRHPRERPRRRLPRGEGRRSRRRHGPHRRALGGTTFFLEVIAC
jgi:DeoR/GlpR family transcriptional regulator of sugar metabolism